MIGHEHYPVCLSGQYQHCHYILSRHILSIINSIINKHSLDDMRILPMMLIKRGLLEQQLGGYITFAAILSVWTILVLSLHFL